MSTSRRSRSWPRPRTTRPSSPSQERCPARRLPGIAHVGNTHEPKLPRACRHQQALRWRAGTRGRRLRLRAGVDPCRAGRERRRQVDADQDHLGRRPAGYRQHASGRRARALRRTDRGQRRRHRLHLPGAVADAGPLGRGQHLDQRPAAPLRPDRPTGAAPQGRGAARPRRLRGRQSADPGAQPALVPPADGGDRQGARPEPEALDPRRGDLGADRCRCREGLRDPAPAARSGPRHSLYQPSHARDRAARRHLVGLQERSAHRDLRQGRAAPMPRSCS